MYNYNLFRGNTYIVKPGDTKFGISKQFGISIQDLEKYNKLDTCVQTGQVLDVGPYDNNRVNSSIFYIVSPGDNIYSIARKYGVTVNQILQANNLDSNILTVGQKLTIPVPETSDQPIVKEAFLDYVVKRGDNIYSIARRYNLSVNEIMEDNNLNSPVLSVGQLIRIKLGEKKIDVLECYGSTESIPFDNYVTYTVVPGDTLYSLARKFGVTVDQLVSLNNLATQALTVGQVLKIREL